MRYRLFLLLALISILVIPTRIMATEPNLELIGAWWGSPERASIAVSGQGITPVTVFLRAKASIKVKQLMLIIPPPLTDAQGKRESTVVPLLQLGRDKFSPDEAFYSTFYVNIPSEATTSYRFRLKVNYDIITPTPSLNETAEFEFTLKVEGTSIVSFSLSGKLVEGESSVLKLQIHNSGSGEATITSVQVSASYSKVLNPMIQQMYKLPPGETIHYDIGAYVPKGIDKDEDIILVTVSYQSGGGSITLSKAFKLPIESSNGNNTEESPFLSVESDRDMLEAGAVTPVKLTIKNLGAEKARDVKLQISSQTVTVVGPSLYYLGDLNPGDIKEINMKLIPSEQVKSYQITLTFTYKEYVKGEDVEKQSTLTVGFGRSEQAKLAISSLEGSYTNKRIRIKGMLANIGNREAEHVNVSMEGDGCYTSSYIGSLGDGESTGFSLTCPISELKSPLKLRVKVKYLASPDKWVDVFREITIEPPQEKVSQPQQSGFSVESLAISAVAGIIVGIILGRLIFRRGEEVEV